MEKLRKLKDVILLVLPTSFLALLWYTSMYSITNKYSNNLNVSVFLFNFIHFILIYL